MSITLTVRFDSNNFPSIRKRQAEPGRELSSLSQPWQPLIMEFQQQLLVIINQIYGVNALDGVEFATTGECESPAFRK